MEYNFSKLRENAETSNCGKNWTKKEEDTLLEELKTQKDLKEIGILHKRTEGGIRARLRLLACNMIDSGLSTAEASIKTTLTEKDIVDSCLKRQKIKDKNNERHEGKSEERTQETNSTFPVLNIIEGQEEQQDTIETNTGVTFSLYYSNLIITFGKYGFKIFDEYNKRPLLYVMFKDIRHVSMITPFLLTNMREFTITYIPIDFPNLGKYETYKLECGDDQSASEIRKIINSGYELVCLKLDNKIGVV